MWKCIDRRGENCTSENNLVLNKIRLYKKDSIVQVKVTLDK
jgi:hypothetical protein